MSKSTPKAGSHSLDFDYSEYIAEMSTPINEICRVLLLDLNFDESKPMIKLAICKNLAEQISNNRTPLLDTLENDEDFARNQTI